MQFKTEYHMKQVSDWLGIAASRPLSELDYRRAHTEPMSCKRAVDGATFGSSYMIRHAYRSFRRGQTLKCLAWAMPSPVPAVAAALLLPVAGGFSHRLEQKKARSEDATREDQIAFEARNARKLANFLMRDDQFDVLRKTEGMTRKTIYYWAEECISSSQDLQRSIDTSIDRVRNSPLIRCQMKKMKKSMYALRERYVR